MPIIPKYTYTDGSVTFTEITEPTMYTGQMIKNSRYIKEGDKIISTLPIINAIDIDWHKAYLSNLGTYVYNSAQLLDIIDNIGMSQDVIDEIHRMIEEGIPTKMSDLINDEGYITSAEIDIPSYISAFINDVGYITSAQLSNILRPYVTEEEILDDERLRGKSAYQIAWDNAIDAMERWPYANEVAWLESLKGQDGNPGDPGKSAYQTAFDNAQQYGYDFPYAGEKEWAYALNNAAYISETITDTITTIETELNEKQDRLTAGRGIDITNNVISTAINEWLVIE